MIENNCTECSHFYRNVCGEFGYFFKDYVAKKTTCKWFKEMEK